MNKLSLAEIVRRIEEYHDQCFKVCEGQDLALCGRVNFMCKKCGTIHNAPVLSLIYKGKPWRCPVCKKRKSDEHRLELFEKLRGNSLELMEPSGFPGDWKEQTKVKCKRCGYEWSTATNSLLDRKKAKEGCGCPNCTRLAMSKGQDRFLQELKEILPTITVLGEYINNYTKIHVRDEQCGHDWYATPSSLLGGYGCDLCARRKRFEKRLNELRPNVQIVSPYIDSRLPIRVKCKRCGHEWESPPGTLLDHPTEYCTNCAKSRGEIEVAKILDGYKVRYYTEYRFEDCKNVRALPFDFYLPDYETCIEYDGEQHYQCRDFFGGEDGYKKRKVNDLIKDDYCRINNIKLLRIPYTQFKDIETILAAYLQLAREPFGERSVG